MRCLLLVCGILLFAPLAHAADEVDELVATLGVGNARTRKSAATKLRGCPSRSVVRPVSRAAPRLDVLGQHLAVWTLDGFPEKDTRSAWRALLKAKAPYLRFAAATALYRAGHSDVVGVAEDALAAPDLPHWARVHLLHRLWAHRVWSLAPAARAFVSPKQPPSVVTAAIGVLSRFGDRGGIAVARTLLTDPRPGIRALAGAFLHRMGEADGAPVLAAAVRTRRVPPADFNAVHRLLLRSSGLEDPVLDALLFLVLGEKREPVLLKAVDLLARAGHDKAVPALRRLLDHESVSVAKAAFEGLVALTGGLAPETLAAMLEDPTPRKRLWAAVALRRMDDHSGLAAVLDLLAHEAPEFRAEAAQALGAHRQAAAVEPLIAALLDGNETVRLQAWSALHVTLVWLYPYRRLDLTTTGYSHIDDAASRAAGVDRIRVWWRKNRDADW